MSGVVSKFDRGVLYVYSTKRRLSFTAADGHDETQRISEYLRVCK